MKTFKVDLDYESYLFDLKYKENSPQSIKIIKEFEYIFFILNNSECYLKNFNEYSTSYLNHLKSLGFHLPVLKSESENFVNWWGNRENKTLEQQLNSKLVSADFAKVNNLGFYNGMIVNNIDEVLEHISNFQFSRWIIKSPFSFSGIGHQVFTKEFLPIIQMNTPMLLEPLYDRVCDLGITFEVEDNNLKRMFIVENFNNDKGSFKGGMGSHSLETFLKIFENKYSFDLKDHLLKYVKIYEYYKSLGAKSNVQIDSFIYKENGELKLYPLVEVNYRKTMGLVIQKLADQFNSPQLEWRITHTNEYENRSEWIKISPENNRFNSYYKLVGEI